MYACYFPIVFAESTPEECPFPVLESAWGSLVGDLDDYLHFLKIDEESHEWKNFLIRIRAKISTKRVLPKVLHPNELLKEEGKFPATKDSIQKRRKRLLEDKSAYIKKYEEEVNTMLEENKDQKNIITPPAGCLTAQMKCNDLKFTLNRLINLKKFLVQVIGVNEVRFYGIERGSIEFFFFMVPKFAVDVEALRSVLSVSNAQLSKACDQLGIVEFHVFVPVPQVLPGCQQLLEEGMDQLQLVTPTMTWEEERRQEEGCEEVFRNLAKHVNACAEDARTIISHRDSGFERLHRSAKEFDDIFTRAVQYLIFSGAIAGTVTIALTLLTGGLAAGLVGFTIAGGLAAFLVMILKWISENQLLRETDSWIMRDRANFKNLLTASDCLEEALKELEHLELDKHEANMYLRKHCGFRIDVDSLMEIQHDLKRTLDILRRKGLASGDEEAIKRTTEDIEKRIQEFLESYEQGNQQGNQHVSGWWDATFYTDTRGIGRVGGEVAWRRRKRPPVGDLVRVLAKAISIDKEMGPIKKMGKFHKQHLKSMKG
jgi:hypothetical protein